MTLGLAVEYKSPLRKLVEFFRRSRDKWKAKRAELVAECKRLKNQTRAVEKSREMWRRRAQAAEALLAAGSREDGSRGDGARDDASLK